MSSLTIRLLGPFRIWRDDKFIPSEAWATQKTKTLFKILITDRGHLVSKEHLIERLWGDLALGSAANSLRVSISQLRHLLEPELERPADSTFILTHSQGYRFQVTPDCWIDLDAFWETMARGQHWARQRKWGPAIAAFRQAEDLYHGDYLEEDPYEEWAIRVRERTREAYLDVLGQLAECQACIGQYHQAVATCEKILVKDPTRESIYRQLMVYQYRLGRRAQALRAYERCRQVLLEQFGVNPISQTQALHTEILRQEPLEAPAPVQRTTASVETGPLQALPVRLPFVGRDDEMERLRNHLTATMNGRGRLVLISGEVGVGKTRLVEEFLALAKRRGAQVFSGQCYELEGDLPYQPIRQGLQPYLLRYLGPEQARRILGPWAPHVALLVPEIKKLVPNLPGLTPLSPQGDHQRLLEGLVQFCLSLTARYPLIFFLDDLHWSDHSTLQFLHRLARRIATEPVLILGAFRDEEVDPDHPLAVLERHLTMERLSTQLTLSRLSPEAVSTLVAQKAEQKWDSRAFARRLQQETEGHPIFMAELLHSLLEEGRLLETEAGRWQPSPEADLTEIALGLPAPIRTLIESRYQAAAPAAQQILELAAVLGCHFDYELLRQASDLKSNQILDVLDELLQRRLIREQAEAEPAGYEFSHHKIREVIYEGLSQARRNHLHRQVARALAALHEGHTDAVVGRLARHDTEVGTPDKTAVYRRQDDKEAL